MLISIRELIERKKLSSKETVYSELKDEILDFKMTIGDFFETVREEWGESYFPELGHYYEGMETCLCTEGFRQREHDVEKKLKELQKCPDNEKQEYEYIKRLEALRKEKKRLKKEIKARIQEYERGWQEERQTGCWFFQYKNFVVLNCLENVKKQLPQIAGAKLNRMDRMPVLTTDLTLLSKAAQNGEAIGIVGGPCLFGFDEMTICVKRNDGVQEMFDFSSGVNLDDKKSKSLAQYFKSYKNQIAEVSYLTKKKWMTQQEINSIVYLFEIAKVLGASVYIPLPDLSYTKYLESAVSCCEEPIRKQAIEGFCRGAYAITDMYLAFIEKKKQEYQDIEVTVMHARSEEVLNRFYQERKPYLESRMLKKVTGIREKEDAVIDYITMLAMPYYLGKVQHVLQVDSSDEADSARKCARIHEGRFSFHSLLYPEYLSADGVNTVFYAAQKYKDYVEEI